jgi:hypothetical protein
MPANKSIPTAINFLIIFIIFCAKIDGPKRIKSYKAVKSITKLYFCLLSRIMISKWILKAIVQKGISLLPAGHRVNYVFQKYITKGVVLSDDYLLDRLSHASAHLKFFRTHSGRDFPKTTLELGTGWYPVVPICNFLAGAEAIHSVDIRMLTNKAHLLTTIDRMLEVIDYGNNFPVNIPLKPDRLLVLRDLKEHGQSRSLQSLLNTLHIHYLVQDARQLDFPTASIDLVHSNNTFEHVFPDVLMAILMEFQRICGGIQSHFIDMSDHFAHFDSKINIYNFLRFSERQWRWIDNSIQPQNRWRFDDYLELYHKLDIRVLEATHRPGDISQVTEIHLAKPFSDKPLDIVAISHCHIISGQ